MISRRSVGSDCDELSDGGSRNSSDEEQLSDGSESLDSEENSEEAGSSEDDVQKNDEENEDGSEDGDDDESVEGGSDSDEIDDDDEDGDDDENSSGEDDVEDDEEANSDDNEEENIEVDITNDIEVGTGITAQSKLYSGLLACRLKVQEAVTAMNQLPQNETYKEIISDEKQFSQVITSTKSLVENTLNELANLQDELLSSRDDTKPIAGEKPESAEDNGDSNLTDVRLHGKRKMEEYPDFLTKRQKLLNDYRDSTLKTVSTLPIRSSFANFESSTLVQIQQILLDKERLVKRTQLIRSIFPVIGKKVEPEENDVEKASRKQTYDVEIFDDSDFFNKLVTQFTSLKTANFSDMNAVSKQWAELTRLRKHTAVVDRRASKGRKTRYTVHRKLVNFMTPIEDADVYSDEQRDALAREVFSEQS